jgi:replicative DNA helicase
MNETFYPSAPEAERAILGAVLLDSQAVNTAIDLVRDADFYRDAHRIVFESMVALTASNHAIDVVSLAEHLKTRGELDRVGGISALGEFARETGTSANIETHCRIVLEKAQLRRLLDATERIRQSVVSSPQTAAEVLESAEREIFQVATTRAVREPVLVGPLLNRTFDRIAELQMLKGKLTGVTTGYPDLDDITSGFQRSDMIIVAGRPGMGKTSLAINMMEAVALSARQPVVFFSLEMGAEAVVQRFLSSISRVPFKKIRDGRVNDRDMAELAKAANRLQRCQLFIDDTSGVTPLEMRSRCRRIAARTGPLGLVCVDYLQLMNLGGRSRENRQQEVSELSRTLKGIARELEVPILVLSQLSRAPAQRADHKPQLSDLRDSGAIEQDADLVGFVHRENYAGMGGSGGSGEAEFLIRKHRNGETGDVSLVFIAELMRFESRAEGGEPEADTAVIG